MLVNSYEFDGCTTISRTPLLITSNLSIVLTILLIPLSTVLDQIVKDKVFKIEKGAVLLDLFYPTLGISQFL